MKPEPPVTNAVDTVRIYRHARTGHGRPQPARHGRGDPREHARPLPPPPRAAAGDRQGLTWLAEGRVDKQDEPTLLAVMAVIREGGGGTWVVGPPVAAQKVLAQVLGRVAGARGYRAVT
jgi:hypothetical protein